MRVRSLRIAGGLLLGVLPALFLGCHREPPRFGLGTRIDFELPTLDARRLGPADYRGQVVILDFMATWCAPCRIQNDVLLALEDEYDPEELEIVVVDSGEPMERVREHFAAEPTHHPVLVDADAAVADSLKVMGFPTLVVLDREGKAVFAREGLTPPKVLREELARLGLEAEPETRGTGTQLPASGR